MDWRLDGCANSPLLQVLSIDRSLRRGRSSLCLSVLFKLKTKEGRNIYFCVGFMAAVKIFLVACTRLYNPLYPSVDRSVRQLVCLSVTLSFFDVNWRISHYYSCPNIWWALSNTAPAHPHATWVAVYPILFTVELFGLLQALLQVLNKKNRNCKTKKKVRKQVFWLE